MIPKEAIKKHQTYKERNYRRYGIENTPIVIHCFSRDFGGKHADSWECTLHFREKKIFDFATKVPFNVARFVKDMFSSGSKYKLIKAIYNDFSE